MSNKTYMQQMQETSYLSGGNSDYIEVLYENYLRDPNSVSQEWRNYFMNLPQVNGAAREVSHEAIRHYFAEHAKRTLTAHVTVAAQSGDIEQQKKQTRVLQLINEYRCLGHRLAKLDPLGMTPIVNIPELQLSTYSLTENDMDRVFSTEAPLTANGSKLRQIITTLQQTYCDTMGVEYMHINDQEQIRWIQSHIESVHAHPSFSTDAKRRILQCLIGAEGLEKYLGTKYVGQKRFSLEGGDSLIPMLDEIVQRAAKHSVKETVIGMAHRGRLNVLINILGKSPSELFQEFEGKKAAHKEMSGDVKYHMGFSSDLLTSYGELHVALAFNPSHLEIINPVVEGSVRSRQLRHNDKEHTKVLPILIHGDAAFAGQGVNMETLNLSQARGYATGGTVHIVVNNQIGFTTSNPQDARSTLYCTDIAKMMDAPVFHVNSDDPEMAVFAAQLALDYRMTFKKDVFIDLVCYRRHGHNEADDPSITQPVMYKVIQQHPTTSEIYAKKLVTDNVLNQDEIAAMATEYRNKLDAGKSLVELTKDGLNHKLMADWAPFMNQDWRNSADTRIPLEKLVALATQLQILPAGFTLHPQIEKLFVERQKMTAGKLPTNWGYAEILAYASLLDEGYLVRLSGQDCGRGTFAHRHAIIYDVKTGEPYIPLTSVVKRPEFLNIVDSILSEEAVLAFEYGFAAAQPSGLVLWEAQFGDFANGAQVVIDQFISSGEQKWGRLCALVMLLPHGYEGQGPEHSSARLERYLQLCAQHNIQVCIPTTPAQCFHMLRRQLLRTYRTPLIVMTPKSLLRHKLAVSSLDELANGKFNVIIPEIDELKTVQVKRIVLCSGKVYYDLLQKRRELQKADVALIRIEQQYPFPEEELSTLLQSYKNAKEVVWCQEEPQNQGAWYAIQHHLVACLAKAQTLRYVGRRASASPAAGSVKLHNEEQMTLVNEALLL